MKINIITYECVQFVVSVYRIILHHLLGPNKPNGDISLGKRKPGCQAMSPHKIPWLFPDISPTILWFSLTMRHIIGISLLP